MLAECGIRIICYNFMPVFDWTRTDLAHVLPDGSDCLSFEEEKVRAVDPERGIELPGWGPTTLRRSSRPCCTATGASGRRSCGTTAAISSGRCSRWRRSAASSWPSTPTTRRGPSSACRASPRTPRTTGASSSPRPGQPQQHHHLLLRLPGLRRGQRSARHDPGIRFQGKLPFVHFRNVQLEPSGDFTSPAIRPAAAAVTWGGHAGSVRYGSALLFAP